MSYTWKPTALNMFEDLKKQGFMRARRPQKKKTTIVSCVRCCAWHWEGLHITERNGGRTAHGVTMWEDVTP